MKDKIIKRILLKWKKQNKMELHKKVHHRILNLMPLIKQCHLMNHLSAVNSIIKFK